MKSLRNQPALVSVCLSWGLVAVTVFYVLAARVRLLDIPLERDEGEYAYAGQLLLDGVLPYQHVYNMKMPGIYALYALLLKVLGTSCSAIHLGLLAANVAAVLMLFFIGRRLCGRLGGAVAAACFAALSVSQSVQGIFANAEHFVLVFALAGVLVLLRAIDKRRMRDYGLSGLLFGAAFLTKQHGFAFGLFGWMLLLTTLARRPFARQRVIMVFACGMLLPFVLCCAIFYAAGLFDKFWFWTFSYGRSYGALVPFDSGLQMFQERFAAIVRPSLWIWVLAGVGLGACFLNRSLQGRRLPLIGFAVCAFISVCPGFFFRPHYFIMLLPAVALLVGCAAGWGRQLLSLRFSEIYCDLGPIIIVAAALAAWGAAEYDYLYVQTPRQVLRSTYGSNPFPESPEIARYIRTHSAEDDRIAVIGSEPQILFYAQRRSATGYIYTYALMESHEYALTMQQEMIREIEEARPRYLVFVNISASWLVQPQSKQNIFAWFNGYSRRFYRMVGIVDILSQDETVYRWGDEAIGYVPRSPYWLGIMERLGPAR